MQYHIRFQEPYLVKGTEYDFKMSIREKALEFYIAGLIHYFPAIKILDSDKYMLSCYAESDNEKLDLEIREISDWSSKAIESVIKKKTVEWTNSAWSGNM